MTPKSRLHIYPHTAPRETAYIVGEPQALLHLATTIERAAKSALGMEFSKSYTSDGHEYNIVVCSDVNEDEWQTVNPSHKTNATAEDFACVKLYQDHFISK